MKTKVISKFGIIFAVALTIVTTAVFTACNSEDDFGGDFNGNFTGQYSLATRMMTRAGENQPSYLEENEIVLQSVSDDFSHTFYFNTAGNSWSKYVEFRLTAIETMDTITKYRNTYSSVSNISSDAISLQTISCFFSGRGASVTVKATSANPYYSMSGSGGDATVSVSHPFSIN